MPHHGPSRPSRHALSRNVDRQAMNSVKHGTNSSTPPRHQIGLSIGLWRPQPATSGIASVAAQTTLGSEPAPSPWRQL